MRLILVVCCALAGCASFEPPKGLPGAKAGYANSPYSVADVKKAYAGGATCGGIGSECSSYEINHCCAGMMCGVYTCCVRPGNLCAGAEDCCSGNCVKGACSASALRETCLTDSDCSAGQSLECTGLNGFPGRCNRATNTPCTSDNECATTHCGGSGTCSCSDKYGSCTRDADCCTGWKCTTNSASDEFAQCE